MRAAPPCSSATPATVCCGRTGFDHAERNERLSGPTKSALGDTTWLRLDNDVARSDVISVTRGPGGISFVLTTDQRLLAIDECGTPLGSTTVDVLVIANTRLFYYGGQVLVVELNSDVAMPVAAAGPFGAQYAAPAKTLWPGVALSLTIDCIGNTFGPQCSRTCPECSELGSTGCDRGLFASGTSICKSGFSGAFCLSKVGRSEKFQIVQNVSCCLVLDGGGER